MLTEETPLPNRLSLKLKTAPATEPISLVETKNFLRVDHSDEDTLITSLIKAATGRAEKLTNLKFITQTWLVTLDRFPAGKVIDLGIGNLISIASVKYYDEDNTEYTLDPSTYFANIGGQHGQLVLKGADALWPTTILKSAQALVVEVVVGFGAASAVPEDIKSALYEITSSLYDNRGVSNEVAMPKVAMALLGAFRVLS